LEFRAAEPADVPAIAQLLLRASPGRTLEHELGYVGAYFEQRETRIQIALDDGTMVGIVSFEPSLIRGEEIAGERLAYLRLIAVDPARWGSGLATELLCSAAGEMRDAGYAEAYLWCGESNARARRFYEREGWREDGRARAHEDWGRMLGYTLGLRSVA
jgi:ribosomal protein S18 acetylase RimI-like enzyme